MNAIKLLDQQHDEIAAMFARCGDANTPAKLQALFEQIADALAIHAKIEEQIFYPIVRATRTDTILLEAVEEHLAIKRVIADLLELAPEDEHYAPKLSVLREQVARHVREERGSLFPKVQKLLNKDQLEAIGQQMAALVEDLRGTTPRTRVLDETKCAATLA